MTWLSDLLPVFVIAFALAVLTRWPLRRLVALGFAFGVLHWIAIGVLSGYRERGGAVAVAFVLVVGLHAVAWILGVLAAGLVGRRSLREVTSPAAVPR
jgi:hypothetical protein